MARSRRAAERGGLGLVAALGRAVWSHPRLSLAVALALLALAFLAVRAPWRAVGRTVGSLCRRPAPREG